MEIQNIGDALEIVPEKKELSNLHAQAFISCYNESILFQSHGHLNKRFALFGNLIHIS